MAKVVGGVGMLETQEEGVGDEAKGVLRVQVLRVEGEEGLRGGKERWDCRRVFGECECEGVGFVVSAKIGEGVVKLVAVKSGVGLYSPVPSKESC